MNDNETKCIEINGEFINTEDYIDTKGMRFLIPSIENLQNILDNKSYAVFKWGEVETIVDMQTANVVMLVYNALSSEENKQKFQRMIKAGYNQFIKIVDFCWKQV